MNSGAGGPAVEFNEAQAFGPWQVAVVPDESRGVVRLEGYGKDLAKPMLVREVPCCAAPADPAGSS